MRCAATLALEAAHVASTAQRVGSATGLPCFRAVGVAARSVAMSVGLGAERSRRRRLAGYPNDNR